MRGKTETLTERNQRLSNRPTRARTSKRRGRTEVETRYVKGEGFFLNQSLSGI